MTSDFAAFLRTPLTVTVSGRTVRVPFHPAAEWALALDKLDVLAIRLASPEDRDAISELVFTHSGVVDEIRDESLRLLSEATGRKWWEAGRLLSTSAAPEVLGHLVLAGVDPWQRTVGEWCAAVYALCVKNRDEKERMKFDFTLSLPPAGYEDEWDDGDIDLDAVEASMSGIQGVSSGVGG